MLFVPVLLTALSSSFTLTQGLVIPRDGKSIVAAFTTISNQLTTLNDTLATFNGGTLGTFTALKIQGETGDLQKDVQNAAKTASASAPLDDQESADVAYAIVSLSDKIYGVLDSIVAKKHAFDTAILGIASASFLVRDDLKNLKNATDELGAALTPKLVPSLAKVAPLLISAIDFHFEQAQRVYA